MPTCKSAIILAGGKSLRMGFSKETMLYKGEALIFQIISELSKRFEEIIVVTNNPQIYESTPKVITTCDFFKGMGPLAGLHAGLKKIKSDYGFLTACDMPNVDLNYIDYMIDNLQLGINVVVSRGEDLVEPFQAFYKKELYRDIENYLMSKKYSITEFVKSLDKVKYLSVDEMKNKYGLNIFENLNTQDELHKSQKEQNTAVKKQIIKIQNGILKKTEDTIIVEISLTLFVNGNEICKFFATPKSLNELIIGYLFLSGYIKSPEEISSLKFKPSECICELNFEGDAKVNDILKPIENNDIILRSSSICEKVSEFENMSSLFKNTGAAHSMALMDTSYRFVLMEEDVSRGNCLDKIAGRVLSEEIDLSDKILFTSCRISQQIILGAIRLGIKAIISVGAVTTLALELAEKYNVLLIAFARENRLNVYTNFDRIV